MEPKIPFPSLLQEMIDLSKKYKDTALINKARRCKVKCIVKGHLKWAADIQDKYLTNVRGGFDLAVAMKYALAAAKEFGLDDELMP